MIREENRDFFKGGVVLNEKKDSTKSQIFDLWEDIYPFNHTNGKAPLGARKPNPKYLTPNMMREKHAYIVGYLEGSPEELAVNSVTAGTLTVKVNTAKAVKDDELGGGKVLDTGTPVKTITLTASGPSPLYAGQKLYSVDLSELTGLERYVQLEATGTTFGANALKLVSWIEYQRQ